jgi:Na+-transporting NADH:ubiquinone oxidoreductase subunit F
MSDLASGVLIVSGIAAFLALLIELAGRFIADYGECRLRINGQRDLVVKGGSPLLFTLQEEGIFIPSACGGKGTCAYCKVKVTAGGGPVLPTETPFLSADEVENHVRLSCQVKIRGDMEIIIPEELFLVREYETEVERLVDLTGQVKGLFLNILSPEEGIDFKPGQYVQLEVPRYKLSRTAEYRAYSIASSPEERGRLELQIGLFEKGIVSTYVHEYLKVGDRLSIRGPFGDFYLRESDRDILMIATGTGLAPLMSILRHIRAVGSERRITLFFGTRYEGDLYCVDELKELEKTLNDFTYVPTLSREAEDSAWKGERGRVTDLIVKQVADAAAVDVYICGNAEMVESCEEFLRQKHIPPDRIFYDKFT